MHVKPSPGACGSYSRPPTMAGGLAGVGRQPVGGGQPVAGFRRDGGGQMGAGGQSAGAFQARGDDALDACRLRAQAQFDAGQQAAEAGRLDDQAADRRRPPEVAG